MRAITLKEAQSDLEGVVARVMNDCEPAIVVTENGQQVVLMPLDEYNAWRETHYLLANPANAAHLRRSIAQAEAGRSQERNLKDE